ncbi:MAG: choline dehydrogenase [Marivibrio sp.]|uniref:choline dehydrogenase n=1 Tax=Marivibrio sp. TaxID=2039719 RepID=UPI0032EFDCEF
MRGRSPADAPDYIIVGAGSAGCVLANRLSADPETRVLLIEAGPKNDALSLKIPSAMAINLQRTTHNWAFQGEPEPGLDGRAVKHDRGKTLGGSSSINGMVCIRGHAGDYDGWRQKGCAGWSYADVLPYFKRLETYQGGGDLYRGDDGPMRVARPDRGRLHPLSRAFLAAGREAGWAESDDICGERQEGFGLLDQTIHKGERWSAARGYLDPARKRANLEILTDRLVRRVVFKGGRAVGVEVQEANGAVRTLRAAREVILSAGAVGSPHLLMLSGVGPGAHLAQHGIDVLVDRPGVGANLNEHPDFVLKFGLKQPLSLWPATKGIGRIGAGLRWLLDRGGVCATNHFETVACLRSGEDVAYPDLQFTIVPIAMQVDGWTPIPAHAFQIHVGLMRADSRGSIRLRSADPADAPRIQVNYLDDPRDAVRLRAGARMARKLVGQPAFAELAGEEIFPGPQVESDSALDEALRAAVDTQWHLSCTARMGPVDDPNAVVDVEGRVIGVEGLRVVDASVMPEVVNGNTNCPTLMIAEKMSDAILGKAPLAPIEAPVRAPEAPAAGREPAHAG